MIIQHIKQLLQPSLSLRINISFSCINWRFVHRWADYFWMFCRTINESFDHWSSLKLGNPLNSKNLFPHTVTSAWMFLNGIISEEGSPNFFHTFSVYFLASHSFRFVNTQQGEIENWHYFVVIGLGFLLINLIHFLTIKLILLMFYTPVNSVERK